jgi:hypothetical protein
VILSKAKSKMTLWAYNEGWVMRGNIPQQSRKVVESLNPFQGYHSLLNYPLPTQ